MTSAELGIILTNPSQNMIGNIDDLQVKGVQQKKLKIHIKNLSNDKDFVEIKEKLHLIHACSLKLVEIVDKTEDIQMPFSVYDGLKQITDIDLENENIIQEITINELI